jgi:hypothetical protein
MLTKIKKETSKLNNMIDQMNLADIHRVVQPATA